MQGPNASSDRNGEKTRIYRLTHKLNQECDSVVHHTTPATPQQTTAGPNIPNAFHTGELSTAAKRGRRQVRRDPAMAYCRLPEAEQKLTAANRKIEKYRKRLQRLQSSFTNSPSPRKKVREFLKGRNVGKDIRRQLLVAECINKQLDYNAKKARGHRQKYLFTHAVCGHILKKYHLLSKLKSFCPYWRYRRVNTVEVCGRKERMSLVRSRELAEVIAFLENDANSTACPGKDFDLYSLLATRSAFRFKVLMGCQSLQLKLMSCAQIMRRPTPASSLYICHEATEP